MQKGFALILVLVGILAISAVVAGAYYIGKFQISELQNPPVTSQPPQPSLIPSPSSVLDETSGESGIIGKVVLGPSCPVVRPGVDDKCQDKPYQGTMAVKAADGAKEITRFTSDAAGNFKVSLAPGDYLVEPVSNNRFPFGKPQSVTVAKGEFTSVTISFDTGIR